MAAPAPTKTRLPVIKLGGRKRLHAVNASGGPGDGSLRGFYTVCGLYIRDHETYDEPGGGTITCANCANLLRDEDRIRE